MGWRHYYFTFTPAAGSANNQFWILPKIASGYQVLMVNNFDATVTGTGSFEASINPGCGAESSSSNSYPISAQNNTRSFQVPHINNFGFHITDSMQADNNLNLNATVNNSDKISIYPNPIKNTLYIQTTVAGKTGVSIFDVYGRKMIQLEQNTHEGNTININTPKLLPGVYLVYFTINGKTTQYKVLKE